MYCTLQDIERRIGTNRYNQLSRAYAEGTSWGDIVRDTIAEASSIVDSYLMKRYIIPVGDVDDPSCPVPLVVRNLTIDIAIYLLWRRTGQAEQQPDIKEGYEKAVQRLKDIAQGLAEVPAAEKDSNHGGAFGADPRVFTSKEMERF